MKISTLLSIMAGLLLVMGCKTTGQKALQQGRYYEACMQAIEKLRSSPNNEKAISALNNAYALAVDFTQKESDRLLSSSAQDKYMRIFNNYKTMNNVAVEISKCPAALHVIPQPDYYNAQLEHARQLATEEMYQRAESYLKRGTREAAKSAYDLYRQTAQLSAGYKDVNRKTAEALYKATLHIVLEQVPVTGAYKLSADFFQDKVLEFLTNNIRNEFVRIYTPEEAEKTDLVPDQVIRLQFLDFVVGQTKETVVIRDLVRDSVVVGTYKNDHGRTYNVYGTVKAKLRVRQHEIISSGILEALIVDYKTNKTLSNQRFPGTYAWTTRWATFNGDERALTRDDLALCNRQQPATPPPPQDMFVQFTVPIFNNLTAFIKNYYRKY